MIFETLKKMGIEDIKALPQKTQMKLNDYTRLVKTPIGKDKEGNFKPGTKNRLDALVEDIILEAKLFLKNQGKPVPEVKTVQNAEKGKPQQTQQNQQNQQVPKKGVLEDLLGW
jgi:hypothetical protein